MPSSPSQITNLNAQIAALRAAGAVKVVANSPLTGDGSSGSHLGIQTASAAQAGALSAADWSTFNAKIAAVVADSPLLGSGTSASHLTIQKADATHDGYLAQGDWATFNAKGAGSVTSVALTVPAEFTAGGTPITAAGTLAITKANQSANQVWAGPSSGAATAPAFRALVAADLPSTGRALRVVDLDLSALSNQTLGTDTTFTVGGYTMTKTGSTNDATAMAIVNGSGLVIQPKSTGDYINATRTIPILWLPFSQMGIGTSLSWFTGVRFMAYISAFNGAANFDNVVVGIDGGSMVWSWAVLRGKNTGDQITGRRTLNSSSTSGTASITVGAANNVVVVEVYNLGGNRFTTQVGQYSSGMPAINSLLLETAQGDASGIGAFQSASSTGKPGDMGVFMGGLRAGSGTALSITVAEIAVDVFV